MISWQSAFFMLRWCFCNDFCTHLVKLYLHFSGSYFWLLFFDLTHHSTQYKTNQILIYSQQTDIKCEGTKKKKNWLRAGHQTKSSSVVRTGLSSPLQCHIQYTCFNLCVMIRHYWSITQFLDCVSSVSLVSLSSSPFLVSSWVTGSATFSASSAAAEFGTAPLG